MYYRRAGLLLVCAAGLTVRGVAHMGASFSGRIALRIPALSLVALRVAAFSVTALRGMVGFHVFLVQVVRFLQMLLELLLGIPAAAGYLAHFTC